MGNFFNESTDFEDAADGHITMLDTFKGSMHSSMEGFETDAGVLVAMGFTPGLELDEESDKDAMHNWNNGFAVTPDFLSDMVENMESNAEIEEIRGLNEGEELVVSFIAGYGEMDVQFYRESGDLYAELEGVTIQVA